MCLQTLSAGNLAPNSSRGTLGRHGNITADQARILAKKRAGEVADGRDPVAEDKTKQLEKEKAKLAVSNTVNAILDVFVARHVKQLRSGYQVERAFDVYVRPSTTLAEFGD